VVDEAEAEALGDLLLQRLELVVGEFDHLARLDVDQMVVMRFRCRFVARSAVAEIMPLEDSRLLEQSHGAVDGGDRDAAVDGGGAGVQRLDVRMVLRFGKDPRDHPPLLGDAQPFFGAQCLDVDPAAHLSFRLAETEPR
jgi:hypothetical protein